MENLDYSDDGAIARPRLHDGVICGILLQEDQLVLPVQLVDGSKHCLVMQGVERLRVDDFRQGNIILDVTVASGAQIDPADVAYACDIGVEAAPLLQKTIDRLIERDLIVVRINPSYGCSAVCICSRIGVEAGSVQVKGHVDDV